MFIGIDIAEDWLTPDLVLEAFEARALRMAVTCAKNLSKFEDQEQGTLLNSIKSRAIGRYVSQIPSYLQGSLSSWPSWLRPQSLIVN